MAVQKAQDNQDWRDRLILGDKGPRALLANAITALSEAPEWHDVLWHDAFGGRTVARSLPPWRPNWIGDHPWTDRDDMLATEWLQHQGIMVNPLAAGQAVETVAGSRKFHPVLEYLETLEWDRGERLDRWATTFLGVDDNAYTRAAAAKWMISAIARVTRPGCKADHMLVLEGQQGILKSTALKTLTEPWFTDELAELGSKDSAMQVAGMWVLEVSELDAMARGDISKVKAFITRTVDRFRPPYGKRLVERARQCVLAGTVNDSSWLRDETGGRRWWPLLCQHIDIDGLAEARPQLWAEAKYRYEAGEKWWLDSDDAKAAAREQQDARYHMDAWHSLIEDHLGARSRTSVVEILRGPINKPPGNWNRADEMRVSAILKRMGWKRWREPSPDLQGVRPWYYVRDEPEGGRDGLNGTGKLL